MTHAERVTHNRTHKGQARGRYQKVKPHKNTRPQRERCAGAKRGSESSREQLTDWRALTWEMDLMAVKRPQPRDGAPPDPRRMQDYVQYKRLIDAADAQYDTLLLRGDSLRRDGRPKGSKDRQGRTIKNRLQPMTVRG